jgi:hypothetical protein
VVGGNLPNHLGDFLIGIKIRASFSWGQREPCVVLWRRLKEVLEYFYGFQDFCSGLLEWRIFLKKGVL